MKKILVVAMMIVAVTTLVFAGCAQPAPAPAPAPVPAPAPSPAPAPKPAPAPAPAPTGAAAPTKPIELSFAYQSNTTSVTYKYALLPWAKKLEDATKGRVKITHYPSESLMKTTESIEGIKSGIADIVWAPFIYFTGLSPLTDVVSLPFMLGKLNAKQASNLLWELSNKFPEIMKPFTGMKVNSIYAQNETYLMTVKKQVRNLADIKGMKLRTSGDVATRLVRALDASPTAIPAPDIYSSLEKGVVDGMIASFSVMQGFNAQEVIYYYTEVLLLGSTFIVAMNADKYNSLPKDIQQAIDSVSGKAAADFFGDAWDQAAIEWRDMLKSGKWHITKVDLDAGELDKWKAKAGKPVWDNWIAGLKAKGLPAQEVFDEATRLLKQYEK